MIYAGSDLKFKIVPHRDFLDLEEQDFTLEIRNGWWQVLATISKDSCFEDVDGNFYFTIDNVQRGELWALFSVTIEDEDYEKHNRVITDNQKICNVERCECMDAECYCECNSDHIVTYEQVWTVNIDGERFLVGSDGAYILTNDGNRIQFRR